MVFPGISKAHRICLTTHLCYSSISLFTDIYMKNIKVSHLQQPAVLTLPLPVCTPSGFEERRELAAQLEQAQATKAAAAPTGQSAQHSSPQNASTSPGSSPQQPYHSHGGPGKPYRSGLTSRPKFKS
jgi:hypothetical protein